MSRRDDPFDFTGADPDAEASAPAMRDPFSFSDVEESPRTHTAVVPSPPGHVPHPSPLPVGSGATVDPSLVPPGRRSAPRLARVALVIGLLAGLAIGVGSYATLATIDISSLNPLATALDWAIVTVVGAAAVPVAIVLSLVALVRSRRGAGVLALLVSLVLPLAAVAIGVQTGLRSLNDHVAREVQVATSAAADSVEAVLDTLGAPGEPIRDWMQAQLGVD